MKFTAVIAAILSMAAFAAAVPVAVPAPANGMSFILLSPQTIESDVQVDVEVRQNHGACVKSEGSGVMETVDC